MEGSAGCFRQGRMVQPGCGIEGDADAICVSVFYTVYQLRQGEVGGCVG